MTRQFNKLSLYQWIIVLFILPVLLFAQQKNTGSRRHDLGKLKWRVDTQLGLDTSGDPKPISTWPQGVYDSENIQFWWFIVMPEFFFDSTGATFEKQRFVAPRLGDYLASRGEPWGIYEYRRYEPPEVMVNSKNNTLDFSGEVDPNIPSDVLTVVRMKSSPGFHIILKTYSFANPYHDDYVINHLNIKYTGNYDELDEEPDIPEQDLNNVWFSLGYHLIPSFAGTKEVLGHRWGGDAYDDWVDWDKRSPLYASGIDQQRSDMLTVWGWDGDDSDISELEAGGQYFDDTGDPSFKHDVKGQFLSYQYPGYTLLHADQSPSDSTDDPNQPYTLVIASIFDVWSGNYNGMADFDYFSSGEKQHPPAEKDNSHWKKGDHMFMGLGPYSFKLDEDIDIVWANAVGGISYESSITKGNEWLSWYRGEAGSTFDDFKKKAFISQGLDSLYDVLSRARWAWDRIQTGQPIAAPLPSPSLTVTNGGGFIKLNWEDMSNVPDPVTGVPDLDHYRVYRKEGAYLVNFMEDEFGKGINYEFIAEVPKNVTTFLDSTVIRGVSYHYFVTTVDNGTQNTDGLFTGSKLESSHFQNRTSDASVSFKSAPTHVDSIRIVPNPYIISGDALNFIGEQNKILFVNLPAYCKLRIFNATGDLIKTIDHTSGSGDESWDQLSESTQIVASGIYILYISECRKLDGTPLSNVIKKFSIIR